MITYRILLPVGSSTLPPEPEKPEPERRQDIAMLYTFWSIIIALPEKRAPQILRSGLQQGSFRPVYQGSVESISGRHPAFLQWAVWSTPTQDLSMLVALYDTRSGLANGQQCSELAYNFVRWWAGFSSRKHGVIYLTLFSVVNHHFWTLALMGSQCGESTQPTSGSVLTLLPKLASIPSDVSAIHNQNGARVLLTRSFL